MKVVITHLKAPWPVGAAVGDVVEFDRVPGWALGKCVEAPADAQVTAVVDAPALVVNPEPEAPSAAAALADAEAQAAAERPALEAKASKKAKA